MPGMMGPVTEAEIEPTAAPTERTTPPPVSRLRRWWRRIDKVQLLLSFVIALGLVLIGRGLSIGLTGDERANLPDQIESVEPVPEAVQVLRQTRVFVDLEDGYTGELVIDGVALPTVSIDEISERVGAEPGEQIELPPATIYEPGNSTLTYTPTDDSPVPQFETGVHRAQVIYWKVIEGRQRPRSYTWTFTVV